MDAGAIALIRRVADALSPGWHRIRVVVEASEPAVIDVTVNPPPRTISLSIPSTPSAPTGCRADILHILRASGHRMTTAEILSEMPRRGMEWSERSVKRYLAELLAEHLVDNSPAGGYGLVSAERQEDAS